MIIVSRLARNLVAVALLTASAGAAGLWVGIPYLERRWTFFPAKYDPATWQVPAQAEAVSFPTSGGARLTGWFFGGKAPRNGITVLLLHGIVGKLPDYVDDTLILQSLGFNVLLFNYRGYGRSDGRSLGEETLALDGTAALKYLARERGIDPRSVALLGLSLGAAVAADLATTSPCRAVVLSGGFASAKEQAKRARPWLPGFLLDHLSSPFDTIGKIARANCPVLVIHGALDPEIPLAQARAIYDAARPPRQLIVLPDTGHERPPDGRRYLDDLVSFLLGTPSSP